MDLSKLVPLNLPFSGDPETPPDPDPVGAGGEPLDDVTPDGNVLYCQAGGHNFIHTGRGRKPKDCPEHRVRSSSVTSKGGRGVSSSRKLDKLKDDLALTIGKVGKPVAGPLPITGTVLVTRAVPTADAIVELSRNSPRTLAMLEKLSMVAPATELGDLLATVAVAIQVDTQRMETDHFLAQLTGVSDIAMAIQRNTPAQNHAVMVPSGPPTFTPLA